MNLVEAKNTLTRRKSKNDQLMGERKAQVNELKEISGVSSIELAEKKFKQLGSKIKKEESTYNIDLENFEENFGHLIND